MVFHVDITEPALSDAEDYVRFIRDVRKEPEAAERWFRGLVQAIYSLEDLPERCPLIPEQEEFSFESHVSFRTLESDAEPPCESFSLQAREGFRAGGTASP